MATKSKLTVTIDQSLMKELRSVSREQRRATSHLVEEALRLWRRRRLEQKLAAGYRAMADENRETAEAFLPLVLEALE